MSAEVTFTLDTDVAVGLPDAFVNPDASEALLPPAQVWLCVRDGGAVSMTVNGTTATASHGAVISVGQHLILPRRSMVVNCQLVRVDSGTTPTVYVGRVPSGFVAPA